MEKAHKTCAHTMALQVKSKVKPTPSILDSLNINNYEDSIITSVKSSGHET
jgi:hypothetical protein